MYIVQYSYPGGSYDLRFVYDFSGCLGVYSLWATPMTCGTGKMSFIKSREG